MPATFFDKFRRVTASTHYLPEIDGLRFLAVFWVAIIMHATHYLDEKFYNSQLIPPGYWKWLVMEGTHGMYLFFMISGFILSLPFAKAILTNAPRVDLKRYYIRRLTRLEPPYIIALVIFFLAHVFVLNTYSLDQLMPSFLASLFYSHGLIFNEHSLILPIAWSLEIEVQFYILAPLLCSLFLIRPRNLRRVMFLLIIIGGAYYSFYNHRHNNFIRFAHYFFTGMLLADMYVSRGGQAKTSLIGFLIGIIALIVLVGYPSRYQFIPALIKLVILFIIFYQVLFNSKFKELFSIRWMTLVGGMCYSIYLLHFGIISFFGTLVLTQTTTFSTYLAPLFLIGITLLILCIAAAYFYFIEKPFMQYHLNRLKQTQK